MESSDSSLAGTREMPPHHVLAHVTESDPKCLLEQSTAQKVVTLQVRPLHPAIKPRF